MMVGSLKKYNTAVNMRVLTNIYTANLYIYFGGLISLTLIDICSNCKFKEYALAQT